MAASSQKGQFELYHSHARRNNVGHYRVRVSNSIGTVLSNEGTLATVGIGFQPVVLSP